MNGSRRTVSTDSAPAAIGPYSQAVAAGGWIHVSGQIPLDPATGKMVQGSVAEQTDRVLRNVRAVLQAAGADLSDVVRCTCYLTDLGTFAEMNEVYGRYFAANPPARAAVGVAALPRGAAVEIDAVAYTG